ncbi:MAG: hypothetical protein ABIH68_06565 [bacterium]
MIRPKFEGKLKVLLLKGLAEENTVAYCPSLELSTCGSSSAEARKNFLVALRIYLKETIKHGTPEKYLIKLGWKVNALNLTMIPPREKSYKNIPLHLLNKVEIQLPSKYK